MDAYKIASTLFKNWDIGSHVKDKEVRNDIKCAIEEAYLRGCIDGVLEEGAAHDALDFFRRNQIYI